MFLQDESTLIENKTNVKLCIAGKGFDTKVEGQMSQDLYVDQRCGSWAMEHLMAGGREKWSKINQNTAVMSTFSSSITINKLLC